MTQNGPCRCYQHQNRGLTTSTASESDPMAVSQLSATPCAPPVSLPAPPPAPPHPMANPGYGKRSAPGEHPAADREFGHLPPREASIAAYIDRLPEGADISVKTLAKHLPYGQCALRTALNRLQDAGHLRRGSECVANDEVLLWVTRTFFSRTARDDEWWAAFTRGDAPPSSPNAPPAPGRSCSSPRSDAPPPTHPVGGGLHLAGTAGRRLVRARRHGTGAPARPHRRAAHPRPPRGGPRPETAHRQDATRTSHPGSPTDGTTAGSAHPRMQRVPHTGQHGGPDRRQVQAVPGRRDRRTGRTQRGRTGGRRAQPDERRTGRAGPTNRRTGRPAKP